MPRFRLGTRSSPLALAQSRLVAAALEKLHPGVEVELVPVTTRGDRTPGDLAALGGKGLFTEELEAGLLDGGLDLAVHSLKDLPVRVAEGLELAAYPLRGDPRDALVSDSAAEVAELREGAVVLTGSLRRRSQLLRQRPDLRVTPVRGNVATRLRKWRERGADGVVLAAAGLARLGLDRDELPIHRLPPSDFVPAPGQGTLAVQTAKGSLAAELCRSLNDPDTECRAVAERAVVAAFGADCTLPLGAWCGPRPESEGLEMIAFVASPDGTAWAASRTTGSEASALAEEAIEGLRSQGAEEVLAQCRR